MIAKFTYPIYWFFSFFNFFPRQEMLLKSRRRKWRPRRQPKLIDGRSIAEATINTKIGSAAPFLRGFMSYKEIEKAIGYRFKKRYG